MGRGKIMVEFFSADMELRVCNERKKIQLYFSYYNEPMGRGRIVSQDNWEKSYIPKPGSAKHKVMKFVCQQAE